jgi:UDP-N-acetylglucosamine transferase subunit ALG13
LRRLEEAEIVVTHGGSGALLDALTLGHRPIVMPRLRRYQEHVNDHQVELCEALASEGRAVVVQDSASLVRAIESARLQPRARTSGQFSSESRLSEALLKRAEHWLQSRSPVRSRRMWAALRMLTSNSLARNTGRGCRGSQL